MFTIESNGVRLELSHEDFCRLIVPLSMAGVNEKAGHEDRELLGRVRCFMGHAEAKERARMPWGQGPHLISPTEYASQRNRE